MRIGIDGQEFEVSELPITDCKDGDILVIKSEHHLSRVGFDSIKAAIDDVTGGRLRVLILDGGMDIQALRISE